MLAACSGDGDDGSGVPESTASVTLDEASCTYEGDETPEAPAFYMDTINLASSFSFFEVDRVPADTTNDEVEAFFEDAQETIEEGGAFPGPPADWRLNRGSGQITGTGSMLVGDPTFDDQMLVAGRRYVVWCSIGDPPPGEPPTAVYFAAVVEPTD